MPKTSKYVRIIDPIGSTTHTTKCRASRYVEEGRADWVTPGRSIRFRQSDPRHQAAIQSASGHSPQPTLAHPTPIDPVHWSKARHEVYQHSIGLWPVLPDYGDRETRVAG